MQVASEEETLKQILKEKIAANSELPAFKEEE